jgi:hypothetical protein
MTTDQTAEQESDAVAIEEEVEPAYSFSPDVITALGLSIPLVIGERLCEAALAKLKEDDAWRTMSYKELRKLFRDNCSDQDGYLSPQAPLLETVVRMLLAAKRDTVSLSDVHSELSDLWITSPWPRHISIESMQRVLDNAVAYGIVRAN